MKKIIKMAWRIAEHWKKTEKSAPAIIWVYFPLIFCLYMAPSEWTV